MRCACQALDQRLQALVRRAAAPPARRRSSVLGTAFAWTLLRELVVDA
jgi:hypothetical protein